MALLWGFIFEGIGPDFFDILGAFIAVIGVIIIFYTPRKGEERVWADR
jgi:small multidrug resistance family-3 protein